MTFTKKSPDFIAHDDVPYDMGAEGVNLSAGNNVFYHKCSE